MMILGLILPAAMGNKLRDLVIAMMGGAVIPDLHHDPTNNSLLST